MEPAGGGALGTKPRHQFCLPQCGLEPTVSVHRNPVNLHTGGFFTGGRLVLALWGWCCEAASPSRSSEVKVWQGCFIAPP